MGKTKYEKKGPSGEIALIALNAEARRRGISYGKLIPMLSPDEQEKVVQQYQDRKAAERGKKRR